MFKKVFYSVILLLCLVTACISATNTSLLQDDDNTNAATGAGAGGAEEPFEFDPTTTGYTGPNVGGKEPCFADEINEQLVELDMIVVLDRSGSMGNKWNTAVNALSVFFNDPQSNGMNIAITYFPSVIPGDSCNVNLYTAPDVALGQLPIHKSALENSLVGETADGGSTPLYGALKGTYDWVIPYQQSNPTHRTIVVLASDGSPNTCPSAQNTAPELASLAEQAFNAGIETYVIGMAGANMNILHAIAYAGGSDQAYDISFNAALFYDKMKEIQNIFNCEYVIPDDDSLDMNQVWVKYISSIALPDWYIPNVSDISKCPTTAGWYFDDNTAPTQINLCDLACDIVTSDPDPKLYFAFECLDVPPIK